MSAYHAGPRRGWVQGPVKWPGSELPGEFKEVKDSGEGKTEDGTECEVLLVVMSWRNGEVEGKFRETAKLMRTKLGKEPGTTVFVPIMGDWEEGLKANGAVGWRDWYVDFEMISKSVWR